MPKSKCRFSANLRAKYPYLETTESDNKLLCKKCRAVFKIASGGAADIERHVKTQKHLAAVHAASGSAGIQSYLAKDDLNLSAKEGVWAYHLLQENHSFRSSDCATKLFKNCFGMESFSCARTKCEAIVTNVFAPHSEKVLDKELEKAHFATIFTDASNHGSTKLFPVLARFFVPTAGVRVKMIDFSAQKGESSEIITDLVTTGAAKHGLVKKLVAYCADNAKVNFGGETRGGTNNVFYRLKVHIPHLLGFGCANHIVHNGLKYACDAMPFDVECVVVKVYSHFYIYAVRTEALKSFCDEVDEEYHKLLGYAKTRFLALGPAIKRILKVYNGLKLYFENLARGETMIKAFFQNPTSKFWLIFIEEQVSQIIQIHHFCFAHILFHSIRLKCFRALCSKRKGTMSLQSRPRSI